MKVLMISRATLFSSPGGDTIQIESTAKYLRKLGVEVEIKLANNLSINYQEYDLLHLFNVIRPNDFLYHVRKAAKPFVLSTIYVDYSEYEKKKRKGAVGIITRVFNKYQIEYFKTIARAILNNEKIVSRDYIYLGQLKAMKILLQEAACLLPNSLSEMRRIEKDIGITNRFEVIPNAVDKEKFSSKKNAAERSGVICVARIEGRKNQLNLVKAMQGLDTQLSIIGKASPNHKGYLEECVALAERNVSFIDHISQDELSSYYSAAKVHILPSWFETTGLSSLEAAYMGCNIIVTKKGDTEEYFKHLATYCEPDDIDSIRAAVLQAYDRPNNNELKERIEENYVWEISAQKTLNVYQKVLSPTT
jgi:glycosyltransferase involved in cell wall biosynthesis